MPYFITNSPIYNRPVNRSVFSFGEKDVTPAVETLLIFFKWYA